MEWLDILRRVEAGESEHIEFKRGWVTSSPPVAQSAPSPTPMAA
jgi:hypothetical protein